MTLKNNRAPLLCCFQLHAWFHSHHWIQTKVTVRKRSIQVKIGYFLSRVTLKFDGSTWKTIGHLFYATLSFAQHFKPLVYSNWSYSQETLNSGQNWWFFVPHENGRMTLKNNRAPLLCCFKLRESFHSHWWIQTGVTVRKRPIWVNIGQNRRLIYLCDLEIWGMTLKNNRAPLLSNIKLCASFHRHMWIQTGVTVRKG